MKNSKIARMPYVDFIIIGFAEIVAVTLLPCGVALHIEVQQLKEHHQISLEEEKVDEIEGDIKRSFPYIFFI